MGVARLYANHGPAHQHHRPGCPPVRPSPRTTRPHCKSPAVSKVPASPWTENGEFRNWRCTALAFVRGTIWRTEQLEAESFTNDSLLVLACPRSPASTGPMGSSAEHPLPCHIPLDRHVRVLLGLGLVRCWAVEGDESRRVLNIYETGRLLLARWLLETCFVLLDLVYFGAYSSALLDFFRKRQLAFVPSPLLPAVTAWKGFGLHRQHTYIHTYIHTYLLPPLTHCRRP
jgi:hypothetical protein